MFVISRISPVVSFFINALVRRGIPQRAVLVGRFLLFYIEFFLLKLGAVLCDGISLWFFNRLFLSFSTGDVIRGVSYRTGINKFVSSVDAHFTKMWSFTDRGPLSVRGW